MKLPKKMLLLVGVLGCGAFGPTDHDVYEGVAPSTEFVVAEGFSRTAEITCRVGRVKRKVSTIKLALPSEPYCLHYLYRYYDEETNWSEMQRLAIEGVAVGTEYRVTISR